MKCISPSFSNYKYVYTTSPIKARDDINTRINHHPRSFLIGIPVSGNTRYCGCLSYRHNINSFLARFLTHPVTSQNINIFLDIDPYELYTLPSRWYKVGHGGYGWGGQCSEAALNIQ
jgi:hypothetical protein